MRCRSLTDLLTHDIAILDDAAVGLELHLGSRDVTRSLPHRVLFDDRTFSTFLVYWGSGGDLEIVDRSCRSTACPVSAIR